MALPPRLKKRIVDLTSMHDNLVLHLEELPQTARHHAAEPSRFHVAILMQPDGFSPLQLVVDLRLHVRQLCESSAEFLPASTLGPLLEVV